MPMATTPTPAARLAGLRPYTPPPADDRIDLRLDANEGRAPRGVLEAIRSVDAGAIARYPRASDLEAALAARWGIDPARVVVTNGGDDAIDRLCRATLEPGRTLLTHAPSFEMIERSARLAGADVVAIPWEGGAFPIASMLQAADERTALVALVTPNNPTGAVVPVDAIVALASSLPGAIVLVDLAYVEFAATDPTPPLLSHSNIVIVRTFSKSAGLAGLRVGYALASETAAEWLRIVGGPFPVASTSLAAAQACLEVDLGAFIGQVRLERRRLIDLLEARSVRPLPSEANFVMCRCDDARGVREGLASRGIGVRGFQAPGLADALRITLPGDEADFKRLEVALLEVLAQGDDR